MIALLSQNELARRIGVRPPTLKARMAARGIEADGVIVNGHRPPIMVFDGEKLPELRRALAMPVQSRIQ